MGHRYEGKPHREQGFELHPRLRNSHDAVLARVATLFVAQFNPQRISDLTIEEDTLLRSLLAKVDSLPIIIEVVDTIAVGGAEIDLKSEDKIICTLGISNTHYLELIFIMPTHLWDAFGSVYGEAFIHKYLMLSREQIVKGCELFHQMIAILDNWGDEEANQGIEYAFLSTENSHNKDLSLLSMNGYVFTLKIGQSQSAS